MTEECQKSLSAPWISLEMPPYILGKSTLYLLTCLIDMQMSV